MISRRVANEQPASRALPHASFRRSKTPQLAMRIAAATALMMVGGPSSRSTEGQCATDRSATLAISCTGAALFLRRIDARRRQAADLPPPSPVKLLSLSARPQKTPVRRTTHPEPRASVDHHLIACRTSCIRVEARAGGSHVAAIHKARGVTPGRHHERKARHDVGTTWLCQVLNFSIDATLRRRPGRRRGPSNVEFSRVVTCCHPA